ncbi:hypothetical protein [Nocardioides coralli]|uniref:hypothetical protein n=1 Tax=Nocardioides coralli TaxID=2872154 RepID=UPI001CA41C7B|nr:hypothetical protein [Nocardioides coralli]QZY28748.1 hypothetical protein K6T13_15005 [Nocardioides coralli]
MAMLMGTRVSVHELLRRSAGGDRAAFGELYDLTSRAAWLTARGSGLADPDAATVLRRVYRELWERAGEADVQADPRGWLLGTVHLAARGLQPL